MKKILLATIIFLFSFIFMSVDAKETNIDELNNVNIEQLVVNVPSKISIFNGDSIGVNIRTQDIDLYENIEYRIENNILYIDLLDENYLYNRRLDPEDIKIYIQVPNEIKKIRTNSDMLVATVQKNNKATNNGKN